MSYTPKPGSNTERLCNAIFDADGPINSRDLEAASGVPTSLHNGCLEAPIRYGLVAVSTERPSNGGRRERLYRWTGNPAPTTGTWFAPKPIRPDEWLNSKIERVHVPTRADVESPTTAAQAPEVGAPESNPLPMSISSDGTITLGYMHVTPEQASALYDFLARAEPIWRKTPCA